MFYTVKEVSEKTGLTPYTIRFYLKEGLFPSIERASNGTRLFQDRDIESFYMIECMKRCGMTISEIRQYMNWLAEGDGNIDLCLNLFRKKQEALERELRRLQECAQAVRYKVWYYETAQQAGTISVHNTMPQEDIPEEMRKIRARMMHVKHFTQENAEP
ncbi:MAG: MerR family transcriptional regulator [Clostridia bacterium]|nr:MerR family transcriptional regulator [Clostridia bacterium]